MNDLNTRVIEEFRANAGRVGGSLSGTPMLLLHHIGVRSGIERVTPLACSPRPDGGIAIIASNGGSPTHPTWYHNLKAHPRVTVETGTETFFAEAAELDDAARADLWPELVAEAPTAGTYQAKTARRIPVLILNRVP
ncbi:nitroreductase/quinone reductase family protein [Streptomyces sp. NPDC048825]|uniref:nitroreductase/quinone reductase family protein n=1 Tax=Streptomyces sp. NPDC048825 TaxID=3365592 RepID=UPI003717C4A7